MAKMRSERYQIALIALGVIATVLFGYFLYREIFPEYRIYQDDYVALEDFRSSYTGEPPPDFKVGVKQIIFEREDKGPAKIDRCTSCHVAVQLPHFSPTKIEYDVNGNIVRSVDGTPIKVPNEDYIWTKLDEKIAELRDEKINEHLFQAGESSKLLKRKKEAEQLEALKSAKVGHLVYDLSKVLSMHPLIGKETRPFEFHPLEEYGCTSCHSGNGRGLTTEKAHGPVFDGAYEAEFMGYKPEFTEKDKDNDPRFSQIFNHKPGDSLLFQTTPILVGNLIQSSCVQCHKQSATVLQGLVDTAGALAAQRLKKTTAIDEGFKSEKEALLSLLKLKKWIEEKGLIQAIEEVKKEEEDPTKPLKQREYLAQQLQFMEQNSHQDIKIRQKNILNTVDEKLVASFGSKALVEEFQEKLTNPISSKKALEQFLVDQKQNEQATGSLFIKYRAMDLEHSLLKHIQDTQNSLNYSVNDGDVVSAMASDIDWLIANYQRGEQLYVSQACYACHRIAGMARGGVGPELTQAGDTYPWYLKESIVWPQADLKTSTMPNFVFDHTEVEDLMTFLLGQKGPTKSVSQTEYKLAIQEWEAGRKVAWEKPSLPSEIHDLRYGMTVFATQGCAACHRLKGFESNVGYRIEKEGKPDFQAIYREREWFKKLFPEEIRGSSIVSVIEKNGETIDQHIVEGVRKDSILEEMDKKYPGTIEAFYSNFRFASRAKNHEYQEIANKAIDPEKKKQALADLKDWKDRVKRILMMYIQEYGLGRLIGPRPNWSGIYRTDEWLMEHFRHPASHVARSIMPIFPFDDSKFYALTYMLDVLGKRNRDEVRTIWDLKGFQPELAYELYCAQCHGDYLQGNGPVANWIYPVPKNLRNAEFLRNLTRENVIQSIQHGVRGTPMPPWGEAAEPKPDYDGIPVMTYDEILKLVDWLYTSLPGGTVIKSSEDVPKWQYRPQDVIEELKREGNQLKPDKAFERKESNRSSIKAGISSELFQSEIDKLKDFVHASLNSQLKVPPSEDKGVEEIFDVVDAPIGSTIKESYYIKKKYYTKENIERGQDFFELNCAACHGKEADGSGIRASIMFDAKPRMLTNLDWIKTRDDMRLLRSIKYGVAGTSMTPWGDLTSSLQRLQLVIFIRTLSLEKEKREALQQALYAFDMEQSAVEELRIKEYPLLDALEKELNGLRSWRSGEADSKLVMYQKQWEIENKLAKAKARDQKLVDLKGLIAKQKEIYQSIGNDFISANIEEGIWQRFLKLIALNHPHFIFKNGKLATLDPQDHREKVKALVGEIDLILDQKITALNQEIVIVEGKLSSSEKEQELRAFHVKVMTLNKMKSKFLSGINEDLALKEQERFQFAEIESENNF